MARGRRGTSLVEMLMVILVIAILVAIVFYVAHKLYAAVMKLKS